MIKLVHDISLVPALSTNSRNPAYDENTRAFTRFFFHARVMRSVSHCDPSTTILGYKSSIPVFISGAALAKLGHPDGNMLSFLACYSGLADTTVFQEKRILHGVQGSRQ